MLVARELLGELCDELRRSGEKIIFTNGCFDILHVGHTRYLAESKRLGDILIVGLNSDSSVKRLKGDSRPVNSEPDRAEVLSALESVDFVSIFDEDTPYELIKCLIPDVITKGGDYNPDDVVGADIVRANGGEVIIINFVEGKSTTSVINKMKS